MNKVFNQFLVASLLGLSQQASALTINFNYDFDGGFFSGTEGIARKNVLESAAAVFENRLQDNLGAIISPQGSDNLFNARFRRPDTNNLITLNNFNVAEDTLIIYAGGRNLGSSLGRAGPGGFSGTGSDTFFDEVLSRGQGNGTEAAVRGNNASDFAPWGGVISFNTARTNWYVDSDVSTDDVPAGQNDLFSVALHELGHVLGIGTSDSWTNFILGNEFFGPASKAENGGNNVPLDPLNLSSNTGLAHWLDGTTSGGQETAMDPIIFTGDRKYFTPLDFAALTDIGWEVAAVPVPSAVFLFASGLIGLITLRRQKA